VAFTSDHGDYSGHRGMLGKYPWLAFEDLVRVPLFYAGYGVTGGRVVSSFVQNYDFALTALDYAGIERAELDFDSLSVRHMLSGRGGPEDADRAVFSCTGMPWATVRHGSYKFCPHIDEQATMLFDLEQDPTESVNRAGDPRYADVQGTLAALLAQRVAKPPVAETSALSR
jgi:choline-sulfatase